MTDTLANPLALIAELTHRCPLHCVYCSNPQELTARANELPTETWTHVFQQAAALGVMQLDLTGGEPLARPDLPALIQTARAAGLYVNLITSGQPLDERRLDELIAAGLDHFQLSFQGARENTANNISGSKSHAQKLRVRHPHRIRARSVLRLGLRQPRTTPPHPRTTRALTRFFPERARTSARQNPRRIRCPGLLCKIPQAVHGRLGTQSDAHHAQR